MPSFETMRAITGALVALFCLALAAQARAEKRVALVIGNSAYSHTPALANPANDAADMTAALRSAGFSVIDGRDLDKTSMELKVRDFANALAGADIGVFFYAGHGLQVGGVNYLLPVDAKLTDAAALDFQMIRLDLIQRTMERETATNILFLDACRDNPLARNLARAMGTRSVEIGRGLAAPQAGVGTLISFSTQPGNVALDGRGRNSPYAAALVKEIANSPEPLGDLLISVRRDVVRATTGKQVPWEHSALTGRFYFKAPGNEAQGTDPASDAAREWSMVDKTSEAELRIFVERHGPSPQAVYAKARLAAIAQGTGTASATNTGEDDARAQAESERASDESAKAETAKKEQQAMLADEEKKRAEADSAAQEEAARKAKEEAQRAAPPPSFRDCDEKNAAGNFICPEMIAIPAGEFTMGSPEYEQDRDPSEGPQRTVMIRNSFAAAKFEATFDEWDACVAAGGCTHKPATSWGRGRQPAMRLSWDDITYEYLPWLSKKTGKPYRLLSEAEWEYAARAQTSGPFSFPGKIASDKANYRGDQSYDGSAAGQDRRRTVAVDDTGFPANPWGLHHMHGNVWEWVEDCFEAGYDGAPADGSARRTATCETRVVRGGSWSNGPNALRSAFRDQSPSSGRNFSIGFRVARTMAP